MATYFDGNNHNTEMQGNVGDALQLQTLILMNQHHHHLPPPPPSSTNNFIFLNSSHQILHAPQHQEQSRFHYHDGAAREATRTKQGLSLSLSGAGEVRVFGVAEKSALSCKYLKVAQELLDEVVNIKSNGGDSVKEEKPKNSTVAAPKQLTAAEKQENEMKKAKLLDMLHQVEERYKQYEEQMQMVIRWLEEAAGVGSAKPYTALALQTISKQFRCLKDAIVAQIGNNEDVSVKMELLSRYKNNNNNNNAWRPQRGLPERSVSVLRAWLFQHFLHPYPKDADKVMLAKQAGLTRSQVSNWFINARVRLWKPMVEEMYAEEMKGQQKNGSQEEETPKIEQKQQVHKNKNLALDQNTTISTSPNAKNNNNAGFNIIGSSEMDSINIPQGIIRSPKKPRNADVSHSPSSMSMSDASNIPMKFDYESERQRRQGFTITGAPANFFGSYDPIVGMEQFHQPYSSNGVSLTLGLQHCEDLSNQSFMPERGAGAAAQGNDFGSLNAITHSSGVYDNIDVHSSKRFAAQLLPDFVT